MPYHKLIDKAQEKSSSRAIGTTGRGIGPCYVDKAMRTGIRMSDLLGHHSLEEKLKLLIGEKNKLLRTMYGLEELNPKKIIDEYRAFKTKIGAYVTDTSSFLNNSIKSGKRIIAEGAQGALLDVDHGTYPYVTSSNPTSGGACTGLGIPPTSVDTVLGIVKAYTTRVGNGPFPTEQTGETGDLLRKIGNEYGATTGRPRRCGWLDAHALKYSCMINGIRQIAITKLDVLDTMREINICVHYELEGKSLNTFPTDAPTLTHVKPEYVTLAGWETPTGEIRTFKELPVAAQKYVQAISRFTDTTVTMVSVGARRDQTILLS